MSRSNKLDNNKETKERLIESARAEFSEKGYTKASLRKICADAGVTTGALYFFFKDKEDLFAAIVEQPFNELKSLLLGHFTSEKEISLSEIYEHINGGHDELSVAMIHQLYANYEAFMLLLTKSQGTRFERCVDEMVDMTDKTYRAMAENMARQLPNKRINSYMLHWLSHMIIDAFIHLLTHEPNEKKAVVIMSRIMNFYVSSWIGLVLEDKKNNRSGR